MPDALDELLARERFAILDGGLATELERGGSELDDPLWSAKVLVEDPARLVAVHRSFASAGADILASASYQATLPGLRARGFDDDGGRALLRRSVALVREAAPDKLAAASIGPYGAYLADGSEYRGDYGLDRAELIAFHRPRLLELCAAQPDLLAFETIPDATEIVAIAELLAASVGPRAWISLSLRPDPDLLLLADGTHLREAIAPLRDHPRVAAIGVNCLGPGEVLRAVEALVSLVPGLPVAAYPNSGERWVERGWAGAHLHLDEFTALARRWIDAGARLVGGCCRTGPAHIEALAKLRQSLAAPTIDPCVT